MATHQVIESLGGPIQDDHQSKGGPIDSFDVPVDSGPETVTVNCPKNSPYRDNFKSTASTIVGSLLIICGIGAVVTNGLGYYIQIERVEEVDSNEYLTIGFEALSGVWTSPLVFLAGTFAIISSKTKRASFIITTMVMSILSAVFVVTVILCGAWATYHEHRMMLLPQFKHYRIINATDDGVAVIEEKDSEDQYKFTDFENGIMLGVLLFIFGVLELAGCVCLSSLCCAVVCCNKNTSVPNANAVYLNSSSGETQEKVQSQHHVLSEDQPLMETKDIPRQK